MEYTSVLNALTCTLTRHFGVEQRASVTMMMIVLTPANQHNQLRPMRSHDYNMLITKRNKKKKDSSRGFEVYFRIQTFIH